MEPSSQPLQVLLARFLQEASLVDRVSWQQEPIPLRDEITSLPPAAFRGFAMLAIKEHARLRALLPDGYVTFRDPLRRQVDWTYELVLACIADTDVWEPEQIDVIADWIRGRYDGMWPAYQLGKHLARIIKKSDVAPSETCLQFFRDDLERQKQWPKPDHKWTNELRAILGIHVAIDLEPGEAWASAALAELESLPDREREAWSALIEHCKCGTGSAPSAKWLKTGAGLLGKVGSSSFRERLLRWFPLVDLPRVIPAVRMHAYMPDMNRLICDAHMQVLRGFCWLAGTMNDADLARALGKLALSAYRKVPNVGPRAVKVGNGVIYALGQMPCRDALGQLALLKVKVKFRPAQKAMEKALTQAAARQGLPREEIEEIAVPTYGLTEVGGMNEPMGEFVARVRVLASGKPELTFERKDGKRFKSVPAAVKTEFADDLKEIKASMKDIGSMLPVQRLRIDAMFLDQRSWSFSAWRERYLDHPLVGTIARRLIWSVADSAEGPGRAVTWLDDSLVDARGGAQTLNSDATIVRLWHPIEASLEEILAWRRFFEERKIQQPFKQAHREVYLLTDAERNTEVYSNRFAAHVLRQHQFHALAAARWWKNQLRLMVDAEYPPASRMLQGWGLRAEFWIEGAGDDYGTDTNESGAFLYLMTDQVRFYRIDARQATAHAGGSGYSLDRIRGDQANQATEPNAPLPLHTIPPLVFSEVMRDVDLFVGVASVGNNPNWQDGGPNNRYRDYWWSYSFGDISETAISRRDLLQRLIPRLKIAPLCRVDDRYLHVKGHIREYKIHLGSGNILMEPNDEYLCIVPSSRDEGPGPIHLPFDGDRTLSIILSKAFLLADDEKIKDPTIMQQIRRR